MELATGSRRQHTSLTNQRAICSLNYDRFQPSSCHPPAIRARNKKLKLKVFLLHWRRRRAGRQGDKESVWAWLAKLDDIKLLLVLRKVHFLRNFCVIYNTS